MLLPSVLMEWKGRWHNMAYVNDNELLNLERTKNATINWLKNLGYDVPLDADWNDVLDITKNMTPNTIARGILNGTITGEFVDNTITTLRTGAFRNCSGLTKISIPNATTIVDACFSGVSGLLYPLVLNNTNSASNLLSGFSSRVPVIIKHLTVSTHFVPSGFSNVLDIQGNGTSATSGNTFAQCAITTIIIRNSILSTLTQVSHIPSSVQEIYVQHDLVDQYKQASNWSTLSDKIKDLKDSPYESDTWYENWTLNE